MRTPAIVQRRALLVIGLLTLLATIGVFLQKPIAQDLSYHNFCDKRFFWGIPSFANVISNLPFIAVGVWGFIGLSRSVILPQRKIIYSCVFTGILLTGVGSAWYHLSPDNDSLVFDRIPMTIVFMAVLAAVIGEVFGDGVGLVLLAPLLAIGAGSICWWHYTEKAGAGDLRGYVLVQYYSLLLIPLILSLFPAGRQKLRVLLWALVWYVAAKFFDFFDCPVFSFVGFVSGHTLKHLAAAVSTGYIVKMFISYRTDS